MRISTLFTVSVLAFAMGCEGTAGADGVDGAAGDDGADGADGVNGGDGGDGADGGDGLDSGDFTFRTDDPSTYTQIDRVGMPAINSAVITSKDLYNTDTPATDTSGYYAGEITTNITGLHAALDDDLTGLGLVPCVPVDCVNAAAPLVLPDTIKIDTTLPAGFANGRLLEDPVMDVTLALVLLDLNTHPLTALVGVNPTANDVAFLASFPYTAAPH